MMASLRKNLVIISFINIPKIAILVKFYFTFLSHSLFWVLFWAKLFLLLFTEKITFLGLLFWVSLLFWVNLLFLSTFLSTFLRSFHLKHFFEYFFEVFFEYFFLWELFWVLFWGLFWGLFLLRTSLSTFLRTFLRTFFQLFWIQNLPLMLMLMLMLWPQAVTPGVIHVAAYHRPSDDYFYLVLTSIS